MCYLNQQVTCILEKAKTEVVPHVAASSTLDTDQVRWKAAEGETPEAMGPNRIAFYSTSPSLMNDLKPDHKSRKRTEPQDERKSKTPGSPPQPATIRERGELTDPYPTAMNDQRNEYLHKQSQYSTWREKA